MQTGIYFLTTKKQSRCCVGRATSTCPVLDVFAYIPGILSTHIPQAVTGCIAPVLTEGMGAAER